MFHLIQQNDHDLVVVMAFRESGKSTIMNMANALWSVLGKPGKKFVVIVSKTKEQAKSHFANIKAELETNELLRSDFGPFTENEREWNKLSMDLEYHGSKILSITRDQSIRGLKHGRHRPDLIICDDLEDTYPEHARTEIMHQTQDLYKRLCDEIITVGSEGTRIVVLGNLLSRYSFIMRLKEDIGDGQFGGLFRAYPFLDDQRKVLWPSKFPNSESVAKFRSRLASDTWIREYLLKIVEDFDQDNYISEDPDLSKLPESQQKFYQAIRDFRDAATNNSPPQETLIEQMRDFVISAPCKVIFPERDSVAYKSYECGIAPYMKELHALRMKELNDRIRKMP